MDVKSALDDLAEYIVKAIIAGRGDTNELVTRTGAYRAALLREAATQIRALTPAEPEGFTLRPLYAEAVTAGHNQAADLIDPDKQT